MLESGFQQRQRLSQQAKGLNTPAFEGKKFDFEDERYRDEASGSSNLDEDSDGSWMRKDNDSDVVSSCYSVGAYRKRQKKSSKRSVSSLKNYESDEDQVPNLRLASHKQSKKVVTTFEAST